MARDPYPRQQRAGLRYGRGAPKLPFAQSLLSIRFRSRNAEAACRAAGRCMIEKPLPPEMTAALTADPLLVWPCRRTGEERAIAKKRNADVNRTARGSLWPPNSRYDPQWQ